MFEVFCIHDKKRQDVDNGFIIDFNISTLFMGNIGFLILENMNKPIDIGNLVMLGEV